MPVELGCRCKYQSLDFLGLSGGRYGHLYPRVCVDFGDNCQKIYVPCEMSG